MDWPRTARMVDVVNKSLPNIAAMRALEEQSSVIRVSGNALLGYEIVFRVGFGDRGIAMMQFLRSRDDGVIVSPISTHVTIRIAEAQIEQFVKDLIELEDAMVSMHKMALVDV